jgi:AraC-like DNA-binding protein
MPVDILAHIFERKLHAVAPAAELAGIVEGYYWFHHRPARETWATLDGQPALLFLLDAPYEIRFTGRHAAALQHAFCCCYGLQNTHIAALPAGMRFLVVKFTCDGLYQLLQRPLNSFTEQPLSDITAIWGREGRQLAEEIAATPDRALQAQLLDAFFAAKLPQHPHAGYLVQRAVQRIRENKGQVKVKELCDELQVNYKWLERNFRNRLGITPKAYMSTIRFLHAYFSVGRLNLTGVALESGYYDQNHFIKEFKRYTGRVPSA